ncbi:MAG TPA: glycosyltransferase family 4 protein [Pyrinomonadaceae bacterium]|nr:glycosyltransferase family 4 protein [Pyrinomonadaceae bacterium]
MRVLYISSALTYGGGERHLVDLAREMSARGHDVYVALRPTNQWQERFDFLPEGRLLHVSVRNSFGMMSANRIARFMSKYRIDLLHAHVARDYLAAAVATRSAKRKLVITRHVMFPMKSFHRLALRNVNRVIAVQPAMIDLLERIFPTKKITVIPNGIDLSHRDDRDIKAAEFRSLHSIPKDAPLVVTLGELKPLKGQRDLVLAANEVLKSHEDAMFILAGKDNSIDQKFRRELKRLVKVLGIEKQFIWLDWLDDITPLLAAADLFVSPSHSESFGLAILDAMAAGTPVVATATDGARTLIADESALVPIKDPLALAGAITQYLDDPDRRSDLAARLADEARSKFSLSAMVDATERVYREVLES